MKEVLFFLEPLIMRFEGLRLKAYFCPAGVLTCGWGTTGPDITLNTVWTKEYADKRMRADAIKFVKAVLRYSPSLAQNPMALAAAADFAYNLGCGRYRASTLRKKLEAKDWEGAKRELMKWTRARGKVLPGLVSRRKAECELLN